MRVPLRISPRRHLSAVSAGGIAAAIAIAALVAGRAAPGPAGAAPAQAMPPYFLPNLQTDGRASRLLSDRPSGIDGIDGFGYSTVELLNLGTQQAAIDVELRAFEAFAKLQRRVSPRGVGTVALRAEPTLTLGNHAAVIRSNQPLGVIARTTWRETGAAVAYEAPEAGKELILPLAAKDVLSYTTSFYIQNTTAVPDEEVSVKIEIFDNNSGAILAPVTVFLGPNSVASYDLAFDPARFGELPRNAAGGFLGSIRFRADEPVTVLAMADEMTGQGASANAARPAARADAIQYLPVVRANMLGDSLIGIANRENAPISVKITYRGAADSPSGANQTFEQTVQIGQRGAAFVDLSTRKRGTQSQPALPRGSRTNGGFYGSATIEASGQVLATVMEAAFDGTQARTSAAYNAYGGADLGTRFIVPRTRSGAEGRTVVAVFNPGPAVANVSTIVDEAGQPSAGPTAAVSAGSVKLLTPAAAAAAKALTIASDAPIAVVAYDTRIAAVGDWGQWGTDTNAYWPVNVAPAVPSTATATSTAIPPTTAPPPTTAVPGPQTATPTRAVTVTTPTPTGRTPTATPVSTPVGPKIFLPAGYRNQGVGR